MKLKAVDVEGSRHKRVLTETGVNIGVFYLDVDGSYYYDPATGGLFSSYNLKNIAALLDEINAPYEKQVKEFFEKEREKVQEDFIVDEFTGIIYPKEN